MTIPTPVVSKLASFIRLLSSDKEGEVIAQHNEHLRSKERAFVDGRTNRLARAE